MCDLNEKFKEWQEWLLGDDIHSIKKQILAMIWDSAVFQSVNEARRYAPVDENDNPKLNGTLHGFIDHCFFQTQALAIRRLLDKGPAIGEKAVCSLYRLVRDMETNRALLTRQKILAALEYPYEYEEAFERDRESNGMKYFHAKSVHKNIDFLAGVSPNQRSPVDTVHAAIFAWLKARLDGCEDIYTYVNKFVAHPATPDSRAAIGADEIRITLGRLFETHQIICQTAQFIGITLFYHDFGNFLVSCTYDQFEHFEKPWATDDTLAKLRDFWHQYENATETWRAWDWAREFNEASGRVAEETQ